MKQGYEMTGVFENTSFRVRVENGEVVSCENIPPFNQAMAQSVGRYYTLKHCLECKSEGRYRVFHYNRNEYTMYFIADSGAKIGPAMWLHGVQE